MLEALIIILFGFLVMGIMVVLDYAWKWYLKDAYQSTITKYKNREGNNGNTPRIEKEI